MHVQPQSYEQTLLIYSQMTCMSLHFFAIGRVLGFFFFSKIYLFLALEVFLDDILGLRFFAIVLNHYATATNHLPWFALSIDFTEAYPFP